MKKTVLINMVIAMAVLIMAGCSKTKKIETPGVTDTQVLIAINVAFLDLQKVII